jgi:hypothetical protein
MRLSLILTSKPESATLLPMEIKTCPQCGTIFSTENTRKVFCDIRCRERHKYEVAKSRAKPKVSDPYWGSFTQCFDDLGQNLAQQLFDTLRTSTSSPRYCAFKISDSNVIANKPSFVEITPDTHEGITHYIIYPADDDFDTRIAAKLEASK